MEKFSKLVTSGPQPSVRSTPATAGLHEYAFFFGGVKDDFSTKSNEFYNELYTFNTKNNTWKRLAPTGDIPTARGFASMATDKVNEEVLIFGGAHYVGYFENLSMFDDLWSYSPHKNAWLRLQPNNQGPSPRSKPKIWFDHNRLYVFGGVTSSMSMLNDLWVYDRATNTWTQLFENNSPHSPSPRHESLGGIEAVEGKLILYGGEGLIRTPNQPWIWTTLNDTWQLDLKTNQWTEITPPNENNVFPPRNFSCGVIIDHHMYIQGGAMGGVGSVPKEICGAPFPQRGVTDELWSFDLMKRVWRKLNAQGDPFPRLKRNSAAAVEGKMYIFSGWDYQWYEEGPGQIWNTHVYCYDPIHYKIRRMQDEMRLEAGADEGPKTQLA